VTSGNSSKRFYINRLVVFPWGAGGITFILPQAENLPYYQRVARKLVRFPERWPDFCNLSSCTRFRGQGISSEILKKFRNRTLSILRRSDCAVAASGNAASVS